MKAEWVGYSSGKVFGRAVGGEGAAAGAAGGRVVVAPLRQERTVQPDNRASRSMAARRAERVESMQYDVASATFGLPVAFQFTAGLFQGTPLVLGEAVLAVHADFIQERIDHVFHQGCHRVR